VTFCPAGIAEAGAALELACLQAAASHPSALIGWNADLSPCAHLGVRTHLARSAEPRLF
jgi:hypothetical protein